jgi:23S rRNA pseudouridine2605 synthase
MLLHNIIRNHPVMERYDKPIMKLIKEGLVRVNGKTMRRNRSFVIERDTFEVCLDGSWITLEHEIERTVILMYKPRGYLCTHKDHFGRDKIYDLLPEQYRTLRSAGRLDQDSEGLLVLSDDGYYLFELTSPKFPCNKVYLVGLKQELSQEMINEAASGNFVIQRDGVDQRLLPVTVEPIGERTKTDHQYLQLEEDLVWYEFTLQEGKYNQIRKMCNIYNNPVQRLIRIQHKEYTLSKNTVNEVYSILSVRSKNT